jgi:hypothetical protein
MDLHGRLGAIDLPRDAFVGIAFDQAAQNRSAGKVVGRLNPLVRRSSHRCLRDSALSAAAALASTANERNAGGKTASPIIMSSMDLINSSQLTTSTK